MTAWLHDVWTRLSKIKLMLKNEFNAFQSGSYPAHLTAPLEAELRRIGGECGWLDVAVGYTGSGRIPGTARHWWYSLSRSLPRTFSDNVLVIGRRPADGIGRAELLCYPAVNSTRPPRPTTGWEASIQNRC